jgi:hypothetical protein
MKYRHKKDKGKESEITVQNKSLPVEFQRAFSTSMIVNSDDDILIAPQRTTAVLCWSVYL